MSPVNAVMDCTLCAELGVKPLRLLCGPVDFPVAIGCREAVKCPVKPPTRLCSRRDTVPETGQTKDAASFRDLLMFFKSLNFELQSLC